jgi:hypothetical protein
MNVYTFTGRIGNDAEVDTRQVRRLFVALVSQ